MKLCRTHGLTRDLDSDCDVTISVTIRIFKNANDTGLMLVLIITIFEFEELKRDETIHVELTRDLVSVTSRFPWPVVVILMQMTQ